MLFAWLTELGQLFRPYQYQCALALIATVLVLTGNEINNAIKHIVRKQHLIIRTAVFVLVCAFGYGLITVWLTELLSLQLAKISNLYIIPVIVTAFTLLGVYAQKQRHI